MNIAETNEDSLTKGFFLHHHSWFVDSRILTISAMGDQLLISDLTGESTTRMMGWVLVVYSNAHALYLSIILSIALFLYAEMHSIVVVLIKISIVLHYEVGVIIFSYYISHQQSAFISSHYWILDINQHFL